MNREPTHPVSKSIERRICEMWRKVHLDENLSKVYIPTEEISTI